MTQRTLSIPVFCLTVLALAVAVPGFYVARQYQLDRLAQTLLVRARADRAARQWASAARELDRYLRLVPGSDEARIELADAVANAAKTAEDKHRAVALHFAALATSKGKQTRELRVRLAELLLETGRLLEAENEAQAILKESPELARPSRVFALARYFQWRSGALASQRPADLRLLATVEEALARNESDIALSEVAATLYREFPAIVAIYQAGLNQMGREQRADELIDRVVDRRRRDGAAHLSRHLYRARYKLAGPEEDLAKALELAPDDPKTLLVAARFHYDAAKAPPTTTIDEPQPTTKSQLTSEQRLAESRRLLGRLMALNQAGGPTEAGIEPQLLMGDTWVAQGDLDQAIAVWRKALELHPRPIDQVACHARIADHLLRAGQFAKAKASLEAIERLLTGLGGTITREQHLALLQSQSLRQATYNLHLGRYSEVVGQVQQAIARQPQLQPDPQLSHYAWDLLGRGFMGLEDWSAAATAFDRAANFQADAVATRLAAARAWLWAGRSDLAVDRAEQVIIVEGLPEAWLILGTAELQIQATLPPLDRSWGRVQEALAKLDQIGSGDIDEPWRIDFLKADYFALRTPTESEPAYGAAAAAEILRLAEAKYEQGSGFWFEACLAYERLGQPEAAQRAWQQLNQLPGAETQAAIAASRRAAMHEDYTEAGRVLEEASSAATSTARSRLRQEFIRLAQVRQDLPQMHSLLKAELEERPRDVGVLCRLAELELRNSNLAELRRWEEQLKKSGPLGELWSRYFRIIRLYTSAKDARDGVLIEALAEQAKLATLRPNWPESFALRGAILQRMDRPEHAVAAYEQAIALGERRYAIFEQLIACLDKLHRTADVEKYLARLESYLPTSQRLTELASTRQIDNNRPDQAVEIARRAVAERPHDAQARLWLGRLLLVTGQASEACTVFQQATRDWPQDARTWNGLFNYYVQVGDKDRARQTLDDLRRHAKLEQVELDLMLGQAHLRLGESAEALRLFAALKDQAPNRADVHLQLARLFLESDRERAKEYLQQAIELDPKLSQARWLLAAILAAGGSEAELAQAEQLLGGLEDTAAEASVEDRRVRALLLAQHGDFEGLSRAVRIVEQIISEGTGSTNDQLLLAQFYERQALATSDEDEARSRLQAARERLVEVASRSRAQPADLAVLIGFLLRHEDPTAAGAWLDRLEQRIRQHASSDVRAIAQLIDLRLKHGTVAECEPWLAELESIDRDPIRPLVARVKFLSAQGKTALIEPLIESKAQAALETIIEPRLRGRLARAIGDLYLMANMLIGAERWYRVVVREDKEQFPVLALTLMRQGRAREAIELCQAAASHDKSSRPAVVLTSLLLEAGGKPEHVTLAEPMLAEALEKFPNDVSLLYGVGMLRVLTDEYPAAIELLERVIARQPRHVAALNNLAVILAESPDKRGKALELIDQAMNLRGQQPTLLDSKGTILMLTGRTTDALSLLEAASRGKNSDPRHKFHLALAYEDVGSGQKAAEYVNLAVSQDLEKQILTPTDRKALARVRTEPAQAAPRSKTTLLR